MFPAGTLLWREGDASGMLVAIDHGRVKVFRVMPNGNSVTLYLFGPGDVFGFMPFLDGQPYPATAQALDEVEAQVTPRAALLDAFRSDPQLAMALVGLLARRLREAFDRIERGSVPEALPRVASAFVLLVEEARPAGPPPVVVELPVAAGEMAAAVGVAPQSFSRAVTRLVGKGVLRRLGSRRFQVLNLVALKQAAGR